jgi:serine/threonine protein phosphatase 1
MNRTIVIGDIHGALRALKQVLERTALSRSDRLIFLGDYVDGWSESAQVLEYIMSLSREQPCLVIKGNHDLWLEQWLRSGETDEQWLVHGGKATLGSYARLDPAARPVHLQFLEQMKLYEVDGMNRLFVHAGFTSIHGPEYEFYPSNFAWDRTLWEMALAMDGQIGKESPLFPKRLRLFNEIFVGHTPTLNYRQTTPMHAANVWNLDTGAAFTGKLSAMDVDTKQCWQSDPVSGLYPGEKGRN